MSAWQMYLDSSLEEAVQQQALSLKEAWLVQDQMLLQQSPFLRLPREWAEMMQRFQLAMLEQGRLPLQ